MLINVGLKPSLKVKSVPLRPGYFKMFQYFLKAFLSVRAPIKIKITKKK